MNRSFHWRDAARSGPALRRLERVLIAKEWGIEGLRDGERIGEIHFVTGDGSHAPLLVKHLHTDQPLSIQVHPRHDAEGHGGKDEAWLILSAKPGATIGLGPTRRLHRHALRDAAADGSLPDLIDWRPVAAGDLIHCPSGTLHCIGAGISLVEVQEPVDITYRLHDFGRDRPLHIEDAVEAAILDPADPAAPLAFTIERVAGPGRTAIDGGKGLVIVPLRGGGAIAGEPLLNGEVYLLDGPAAIECDAGAALMIARPARRFEQSGEFA